MNKCKAPKIPPLLITNLFVLNYREKVKLFTKCFSQQCKPVSNGSVLPNFIYLTNERIEQIPIENEDIISLIRKLNPNKANGPDVLSTAIYPDMWKLANATPIFQKGDKQLITNYRPISLLPVCGKIFEKIIYNNLYKHLTKHHLITKNQSGFSTDITN